MTGIRVTDGWIFDQCLGCDNPYAINTADIIVFSLDMLQSKHTFSLTRIKFVGICVHVDGYQGPNNLICQTPDILKTGYHLSMVLSTTRRCCVWMCSTNCCK
eukprot:355729_1